MSVAPEPLMVNITPSSANVHSPSCSICLSEFSEREGKYTLGCQHSFHPRCVTQWLMNNNHCPNCRATIAETDRLPEIETRTCGMTKSQWSTCRRRTQIIGLVFCYMYSIAMMMAGMILIGLNHIPSAGGTAAFILVSSAIIVPPLLVQLIRAIYS